METVAINYSYRSFMVFESKLSHPMALIQLSKIKITLVQKPIANNLSPSIQTEPAVMGNHHQIPLKLAVMLNITSYNPLVIVSIGITTCLYYDPMVMQSAP